MNRSLVIYLINFLDYPASWFNERHFRKDIRYEEKLIQDRALDRVKYFRGCRKKSREELTH